MSDLSLDALTQGRDGVTVWSVQLRRVTSEVVSPERLASAGLELLAEQRVFQLPADIKEGATYMSATIEESGDDEAQDDWILDWDRIPNTDVPEYILENRIENLEEKLRAFWAGQAETASMALRVDYLLEGYDMQLEELQPKKFGPLTASVRAAFWTIEGAQYLTAVSPIRAQGAPLTTALGTFSAEGFPDVEALETAMWQELQPLLKRKRDDDAK